MELNKIRQRLELALKPAKPPTLEEVLEQVSTRGVLRGPVDWVFLSWMLYVEYAAQKIAESFQLTEEERSQLSDFRDTLKRLLLEAQRQARAKLTILHKAISEGTYRVEGRRLYAPDGTWIHLGKITYIPIHGVSASARFPDVLKLPRERLEPLQIGWRASDEGSVKIRPVMSTTQPWQVFAWVTTRYGELHMHVTSANLTNKGVSILIRSTARSWRQKWSKDGAIDLVVTHLRHGEWASFLTMWLGDGETKRREVLHGKYRLIIVTKEPWRLGKSIDARKALVASGREAFERLRETAGAYGELLDLLKAHKWIYIKLATDDGFRARLKTRKRSIDVLREMYRHNNGETPTEQFSQTDGQRIGAVVVAGIVMYLRLKNGKGGSLIASRSVRDVGKAFAIAERLEFAGLRPNIVKSGSFYMVYISTADLLKLAEKDDTVRRAVALCLAEKVKNGTPRQREIAEKFLKRNSLFSQYLSASLKPTSP